ncbi:MAG: 23S rRNA pseudouridine(1911/1915/1917) synthase RluD [Betaproteobacteria bacterium]|nr:23S rRNA pseudouridine(1911/1915/1917) synthase RluD [Betaproteobacteria bacterium]
MNPAPKLENYNATRAPEPIELTVPPQCAGRRLDQALAHLLPEFSRSRLAHWIRASRITLDGRPVLPKAKVWGGEKVLLVAAPDPAATAAAPEAIALDIIHEDATVLVIAKPTGLVVHPGSGNWSGTLLNALLAHAPQLAALPRAGIVHRLDKDTSGLLVIAKTLEAQVSLVRQLQARTVKREYLALVHGRVARAGRIEAPIGRHPAQRTRMAIVARGKPAATHYEVLERFAHATLLRCRLETGRTHQIRVHLQSLGHPLIGDPVYGRNRRGEDAVSAGFSRQALHAERLEFQHPASGKTVAWQAPPPADMRGLIAALRTTHEDPA